MVQGKPRIKVGRQHVLFNSVGALNNFFWLWLRINSKLDDRFFVSVEKHIVYSVQKTSNFDLSVLSKCGGVIAQVTW